MPCSDAAQPRAGGVIMARKLPRWALVGGILAGAAALATAADVAVRRLFGGGYEERPLGEPIAYPAAGAGTGFPEPTSPDNTETVDQGVVPELRDRKSTRLNSS